MKRRNLLGIIAAASVGSAAMEPLARLLDGFEGRGLSRVGLAEVQAVEAAADLYTRMDLAHGGGMAAAMARGSLEWAIELLDKPMSQPIRERLSSAIGLLADRFGWAIYDAGDISTATRVLTLALDNSAHGGDRDLRAHVMLDLSTVTTDSGRPAEGVEILRMALGDERISSAERANLHAVAARHCAAAHDRQAGLRHVDLAEEALSKPQQAAAPEWAQRITVSPGHHDSALGLALFALDEDTRAYERLSSALSRLDTGRTRTGLRCRTRLAVLNMRAGDLENSEREARRAVKDAIGVRSRRVSSDLTMMIESARSHGMGQLADELARSLAESAA
ncbi:hypothetical protein N5079_22225 [Planotetraspora sp. A-T 1434]|uniref:hypothetical protein n=1 Tax=Planotetraspora sp. A-T 1434 TaxID=2979219 RepID=UPI0021BE2C03|nr:hypothetical protein [Planotetraspora sp. A-T 1434]MCT9932928.1 hypothetical protein [Planotetraspora sp. A-T 1434]